MIIGCAEQILPLNDEARLTYAYFRWCIAKDARQEKTAMRNAGVKRRSVPSI